MKKLLITGGAGFIGSAAIRHFIQESDYQVLNLDKLTYAGNLESLAEISENPRYRFINGDIANQALVTRIFNDFRPDALMHLAAESHVDRSIEGPADFIQTNIIGTFQLLEAAKAYWQKLGSEAKKRFRFHHVSTDEVYGDLIHDAPAFTEETPYSPSSPYSASKASSDHLVRSWHRTYGLPILITNCSNNYGPYQFPEKLIPLTILNAIENKAIPIYGKGDNVRDWLHVNDHVQALHLVLVSGEVGRTYNIGGQTERTNLEVVHSICTHLNEVAPRSNGSYEKLITFTSDRPGHDRRYAIDNSRITQELGWQPLETFDSGLRKTVLWYLKNLEWVNHIRTGTYREFQGTNKLLECK